MHYRNTPLPLDLDQPLNCNKLGAIQDTSAEAIGFYPVRPEFHQTLQDRILNGKLTFFEHGLVFNDMRLGAFVLLYTALERVTIHGNTNDKKDWMQFTLNQEGQNLVPCSHIAEPTFYLLVSHEFANSTILKIQKLTEDMDVAQIRARNQRRKDKEEKVERKKRESKLRRQTANQAQAANQGNEDSEEEKEGEDEEADSTAAETTAQETMTEAAPSEAPTIDDAEQQEEQVEEGELPHIRMPIVDKAYEEVTRIVESFSWKNFLKNDKDYKASFGSE